MKKKECPNPIIISSNIGIGNLVKETLPSAPYINPPFAFPALKEKHKCISVSAQTQPASARTRKTNKKISTSGQTRPASAQTDKKKQFYYYYYFILFYFSRIRRDATNVRVDGK
jgi:hypothetical protein